MFKAISTLVVCLFLAGSAVAQPIHGHPQKAAYASPAEWPTVSAQQHWANANALAGTPFPAVAHPVLFDLLSPRLGHVHINCTYPLHGEVTDKVFTVDCSLMAFHLDGVLWGFNGEQFASEVWAETGTSTPPILKGDPTGLKEWKVKVTIDPRRWPDPTHPAAELLRVPLHGWADIRFFVRAYLMNGGVLDTSLTVSSFSTMDVSAPERKQPQQTSIPGIHVAADCTPTSAESDVHWGQMFIDLHGYLPITPIATKWTLPVLFYNYTGNAAQMVDGFFEQRHDPDLHMGKLGTLIQHIPAGMNGHNGDDTPVVFDPTVMGAGVHRVMLSWNQPVAPETSSCLLVVNIPVDPNAPPPQLCADPKAPNFGGPLPCLPPVVVTPPTLIIVPTVAGLTQSMATVALTGAGLTLGTVTRTASVDVLINHVISSAPVAGVSVAPGTAVSLVVSTGPPQPPVDTWDDIPTPTFKQFRKAGVLQNQLQACSPTFTTPTHCVELTVKQD